MSFNKTKENKIILQLDEEPSFKTLEPHAYPALPEGLEELLAHLS